MADAFADELRKLMEGVNQPQSMYAGWENGVNQAADKGGNNVYATPFDRQGGAEVAQRQLDLQARDILDKMHNGDIGYEEALRRMEEVLKGDNISPADRGAGPVNTVQENTAFNYGANSGLSAEETRKAAEEAKKEEAKKGEEKDKERKEMAAAVYNLVQAQVASVLDQKLTPILDLLKNQTTPATHSAPAQASTQEAGAWRDNPGVQMPFNSKEAVYGGQAAYSAFGNNPSPFVADNPHQATADKFFQAASEFSGQIRDPQQLKMFKTQSAQVYATLLSGIKPNIDDPMLQNVANKAGVQYNTMGLYTGTGLTQR